MEPEVMYTIFRRSHETPCASASPSRATWISESQRGANILSRAFQAAWNVLRNINLCSVTRQIKKWSLWRVVRILSNVELVHWKKGLPKKEKKKSVAILLASNIWHWLYDHIAHNKETDIKGLRSVDLCCGGKIIACSHLSAARASSSPRGRVCKTLSIVCQL